jgi:dihydrofolate reductase
MATLSIFNFLSANGFFKGPNDDISWHFHGEEEGKFSDENSQGGNILLFGRKTFQMMESFWPTDQAKTMYPVTANGMNSAEKIVFSKTLSEVKWNNSRIIKDNLVEEVKKLKEGKTNITILGSGSVITQLADHNLIDEYSLMIDPILIGNGTSFVQNLQNNLKLKFKDSHSFKSGTVVLNYLKIE